MVPILPRKLNKNLNKLNIKEKHGGESARWITMFIINIFIYNTYN